MMRQARVLARASLGVALSALFLPVQALAAPACADPPTAVNTLVQGESMLESVIVDQQGRLFYTNETGVMRLDEPAGTPQLLATVESPGGLALDSDGSVIVGSGNSVANGTVGDQTGPSQLVRINPDNGAQQVYATGLSMGNGLDRAPDGSFYASNDFGMNIDRIRNGQTERGWAHVQSGNGLVVDSTGRYLYVNQTFQPAAIQRVDLATAQVTPYVIADPADISAGLDGLARDAVDTLFAAANGAGEIWRISGTPPQICVLLDNLPAFPDGPSAVATGKPGTDFPATNLYVVTFDGKLLELADVATAPSASAATAGAAAPLTLRVRPRRASVGGDVTFRFKARIQREGRLVPLPGATIRFGGESTTTNVRGRARIIASFNVPGRRLARLLFPGYSPVRAPVRIHP
jgi:gluconolactonase